MGERCPQYSQRRRPWLPRLFFLFVPPFTFITFPTIPIYKLNTGVKEGYYREMKVGLGGRKRRKADFTQHIRQHSLMGAQLYSMAYCLPPPLQAPGPISSAAGTSLCFLAVSCSGLGALQERETLSNLYFHLEHLPQCVAHSCSYTELN